MTDLDSKPNIEEYNLAQLMDGDATYAVPTYQRDYAWQEEQVSQLIGDLEQFVAGEDQYYILGQIIIAPNSGPSSNSYKYMVVDGQQRMTTLYLLFVAITETFATLGIPANMNTEEGKLLSEIRKILWRTNKVTGDDIQRFMPCPQASSPMEKLLQGIALDEVQPNNSSVNVKNNYELLSSWLKNSLRSPESLVLFTKRVLYSVYLIAVKVSSEEQALSVFEKINNRGMPLNSSDLLKYLLFQNASANQFEDINKQWADAGTAMFGAKPHAVASVQYLMQALLQPETGKFVASKDVHKKWLELFKADPQRFKASTFVGEISESAKVLSKIASQSLSTANEQLFAGRYFNVVQHIPVVLEAWKISEGDTALFSKFCDLIDARTALSLYSEEGANSLNIVMWKWSKALRETPKGSPWETYLEKLDVTEQNISLLFHDARPRFLSYSYTNSKERKRIRFALAVVGNHVESLAERENSHSTLSQILSTTIKNQNRYDIDHIYAKSLVDSPNFNESYGREWVNRIGNLCLLHATDNHLAGTTLPSAKSQAYATSKLILTQLLANQHDNPSLWGGSSVTSKAARALALRGAVTVEDWNWEKADNQADFYFQLFEEALRKRIFQY